MEGDLSLLDNFCRYFDFHRGFNPKMCSLLKSFIWLETIIILETDSATHALYYTLYFSILNLISKVDYVCSKFPRWVLKNLKYINFD